jgi:hypothetical protein
LHSEPSFWQKKNVSEASVFLYNNIRHFAQVHGFEAILTRIKNPDPKIPLICLKICLKLVARVRQYNYSLLHDWRNNSSQARESLTLHFLKRFVQELNPRVFDLILNLTDDELKNEDRKVIADISNSVEVLLKMMEPAKASEIMERFNLKVAYKCFKSPYLEKRLCGLNDIKDFIGMVTKKHEYLRKQPHPEKEFAQTFSLWTTPQ